MRRRDFLQHFLLLLAASPAAVAAAAGTASRRASIAADARLAAYINHLHATHDFSKETLQQLFAGVSFDQRVLRLVGDAGAGAPAKTVYWRAYRRQRITAKKILGGLKFYRAHQAVLKKTERAYAVPAEILTAIIGIETNYGAFTGRYSVLRALATLAFGHSTRGAEFLNELTEFLLYARRSELDPLSVSGSYAGAIGIPQFMPSSIRKYAVTAGGSGSANLFSPPDAIHSVGNFLKSHGWRGGVGISYSAQASEADAERAIAATTQHAYKPFMSRKELRAYNIYTAAPDGWRYLFVDLENRYDREYRVGTENFYALTRYNRSFKYAAAVTDLAGEIRSNL